LYSELLSLIADLRPDEVAVETPFVSINARAAMAIGQAQGLALMAAAEQGLLASNYSPPQVKLAVSGHGHASKQQVQQAIALQLDIDLEGISDDATDALAVALCHVQNLNEASLVVAEGIKPK
jgi:crossover junction endodeoxyribonuclease RuvC